MIYLHWTPDEDDLKEMVDDHIEANEITDVCRHDIGYLEQDVLEGEWEYVIDDFRDNVLGDLFPSVGHSDGWAGDEDRIVAENGHAFFGVSEYAGIAALWVVPKTSSGGWNDADSSGLALHWIDQAWPKVEARYPSRLNRLGTMSNGESVYSREGRTET